MPVIALEWLKCTVWPQHLWACVIRICDHSLQCCTLVFIVSLCCVSNVISPQYLISYLRWQNASNMRCTVRFCWFHWILLWIGGSYSFSDWVKHYAQHCGFQWMALLFVCYNISFWSLQMDTQPPHPFSSLSFLTLFCNIYSLCHD